MSNSVKMGLLDFVNAQPGIKSGKIEFLAAYIHWMEFTKKIVFATEEDFTRLLEEFKSV